MPSLYLVRHGQASFGAEDYDHLSGLGVQQSQQLGRYFQSKSLRFDAVYTGTLRRHAQTLAGIAQGMGCELTPGLRPGLNEYDSEAVIRAIHSEPLARERSPENDRKHFLLLREGLAAWMEGRSQPQGMPSHPVFLKGITDVLDELRAAHGANGQAKILMVTSGGPISTAVGHLLGLGPAATIELNLRIRNTSLTECVVTAKRMMLLTFNTLAHLDHQPDWVTYA
jgi:broad specificity phosphatase PhoE